VFRNNHGRSLDQVLIFFGLGVLVMAFSLERLQDSSSVFAWAGVVSGASFLIVAAMKANAWRRQK
jgi:hypothetical protein